MLTLNHVNLPVEDVPALRDFFIRHFGFVRMNEGQGDSFAILEGEGGVILNVMRKGATDAGAYPENFHVGFLVDTPDIVHQLHAQMTADGLAAGDVEHVTRRGFTSVTFYLRAPNDVLVEVSCLNN